MKRNPVMVMAIALLAVAVPLTDAWAGSARDKYTKAQQKKIYEYVLRECRKRFPDTVAVIVDYRRNRYTCRYFH